METKIIQTGFGPEFFMARQAPEVMVFDLRLIYVLSGEMSVHIGAESFKARTGDFFVINVGQIYCWEGEKDCLYAQMEMSYGQFCRRLQTPYIQMICNSTQQGLDADLYHRLQIILVQLVREYAMPSSMGFRQEYLWYNLMDMLARNFIFSVPRAFSEMTAGERMICVIQYICANYCDELPMEEAAKKMYLSMSAFSRWFKKQSGINYGNFVQQVRMFHSIQDLLYTEKSITDTALDNGFSSAAVFTKLFRKNYGITPTEYRRKYRRQQKEKISLAQQVQCSPEIKSFNETDTLPGTEAVLIDTQQSQNWEKSWNQAINVDEAVELMSARMQQQIIRLQEQLGFKYVRLRNIFSEKLKLRQKHSIHGFNYDNLDTIMDFIISQGMHPFINLCDREHSIRLAVDKALYSETREDVFMCETEMLSVITDTFSHFVMRYGISEVSSWLIEYWYDDQKYEIMGGNEKNYARVFQKISQCIKSIVPEIKIGGCGLALSNSEVYFRNIVKEWKALNYLPDFVSIYIYPYTDNYKWLLDFDYTRESLELGRNILKLYGMEQTNILVTEWNLSSSARNFYNDSCAKASMLLRHAVSTMGQAQMYIYSMASDLITNYYDSSALLFGSPGLLSKDGLRKPVFYALLFMNRLSGKLLSSGPSHIVTGNDHGEYRILLFNAKSLGYKYYLEKEYAISPKDLENAFEDMSDLCIDLEIKDVVYQEYFAKYEFLDNENGSLLDIWLDMGVTEAMTVKDIDYIESRALPRLMFRKYLPDGSILRINEKLKPHEIRYIHIYPSSFRNK